MTRRRVEIAALFLGWFLALGFISRALFTASSSITYTRISSALHSVGRDASAVEGNMVRRARGGARRDRLKELFPNLHDPAALKNPAGLLWGAFDGGFPQSMEGFADLEQQMETTFPLVSLYQAWGDLPENQFPTSMMETIAEIGSIPIISWEPWVTTFDREVRTNLAPVERREFGSLAAIARGDYDFHIVRWAEEAAAYKKPFFIRFAHEMNDPYRYPWGPQNGNRAEDFIAAWRHVHLLFEKKGAANAIWVWSPHLSMPWLEYYYPGPDVVDWIGFGVLNYGTVASWSRWWNVDDMLERPYVPLSSFKKPMMITEFGTLPTGGDPRAWITGARVAFESRYPEVHAIVLYNQTHDDTLGGGALNWSPLAMPGTVQLLSAWMASARIR
ncbi:MAG: glycosyl hydrolase [Thermoanaerobaculia bacterium]